MTGTVKAAAALSILLSGAAAAADAAVSLARLLSRRLDRLDEAVSVADGAAREDPERLAVQIRLARLCQEALKQDPFCGWVFVFRNRPATAVKIPSLEPSASPCQSGSEKTGHIAVGIWPAYKENIVADVAASFQEAKAETITAR